jgi:ABC-2 type transport system ATP-binding protein
MITAKKLTKRFSDKSVVHDLSFDIEKGEVLGFLGPNGAGKTTTMRMLTCYFPPTSGSATVAGFDVQTESMQVRKNIGYLPEQVPLYPEMTALEYVDFAASAKGVPSKLRKQYVGEALDRCNLSAVSNQLVGTLSRGFRQRVGLAQAIVNQPKVLILDEPTVGLDPAQIRDIRSLIKSLAESSTVILSTHILPEVEALCKRVIIISKGHICAIDTPANLNRSLQGVTTVQMQIDGAATAEVLEAVTRVQGVRKAENPMPGQFRLEIEGNQDPRAELSRLVVGKGWNLLELTNSALSLEDIFLSIVKEDAGAEDSTVSPAEALSIGGQA